MSRASNQSILMLALVRANFLIAEVDGNMPEEIAPMFMYASDLSEKVVSEFPETGDTQKNRQWMHDILQKWKGVGNELEQWHPLVLMTVSLNILEDLLSVLRNKQKRDAVKELIEAVVPVAYYFTDKVHGDEYIQFKEADRLIEEVYGLMGFSRA